MRPIGSPAALERRRGRAIGLLEDGRAPVDVARIVGVDRRSVRRWKASYRDEGTEALKAKPVPGRPSRLDEKSKVRLEKMLLRGARAAGFPTDLWTCSRVARVIRQRFGVRYHVDYIGPVLRSMGWSPKKPVRRAVERDEEEIQRWVREDWPRAKKKPRG